MLSFCSDSLFLFVAVEKTTSGVPAREDGRRQLGHVSDHGGEFLPGDAEHRDVEGDRHGPRACGNVCGRVFGADLDADL